MEVIEGSRQPAGNVRNCMVLRSWFLYRVCVFGISSHATMHIYLWRSACIREGYWGIWTALYIPGTDTD